MPRNYQRSVRIDDELQKQIETLPYGTFNNLVNSLLNQFFTDEELQLKVGLEDSRFVNWKPHELKPIGARPERTRPKPDTAREKIKAMAETHYAEPVAEETTVSTPELERVPTTRPLMNLDDLMPGL